MVEQWRPTANVGEVYEVSNRGNVRNKLTGNILSPYSLRSGHQCVSLYDRGKRYRWVVSALVLTAFIGPRPEGDYHACHNNGDPTDNRLDNLRWDTRSGNELDKRQHGTHYEVNRTHCPRQHPLEHPNLVKAKLAVGSRECLTCNRTRSRIKGKRWSHYSFDELSDIIYEEIIS